MYSRATTSAMADRVALPAGFFVLGAISIESQNMKFNNRLITLFSEFNAPGNVSRLFVNDRCR